MLELIVTLLTYPVVLSMPLWGWMVAVPATLIAILLIVYVLLVLAFAASFRGF